MMTKIYTKGALNYIGRGKDQLLSPEKCLDRAKDIRKTMAQIYELYQND